MSALADKRSVKRTAAPLLRSTVAAVRERVVPAVVTVGRLWFWIVGPLGKD